MFGESSILPTHVRQERLQNNTISSPRSHFLSLPSAVQGTHSEHLVTHRAGAINLSSATFSSCVKPCCHETPAGPSMPSEFSPHKRKRQNHFLGLGGNESKTTRIHLNFSEAFLRTSQSTPSNGAYRMCVQTIIRLLSTLSVRIKLYWSIHSFTLS